MEQRLETGVLEIDVMRATQEGYDSAVVEHLRARGHAPGVLDRFERGGAQLLLRDGDTFVGGSDRRKDGVVAEVTA